MDKQLLTFQEAADLLGVSRWTVFRLAKARELVTVKVRGCRRVVAASLTEYVARQIEEAA